MPDPTPPMRSGQLIERRPPTGVVYAIRTMFTGRRLDLPPGHEREGSTAELAARVLAIGSTACGAQRAVCCAQRRRRRWRRG